MTATVIYTIKQRTIVVKYLLVELEASRQRSHWLPIITEAYCEQMYRLADAEGFRWAKMVFFFLFR